LLVFALSLGLLVSYLITDPVPGLWGTGAIALSWPVYRMLAARTLPLVAAPAD